MKTKNPHGRCSGHTETHECVSIVQRARKTCKSFALAFGVLYAAFSAFYWGWMAWDGAGGRVGAVLMCAGSAILAYELEGVLNDMDEQEEQNG